MNKEKFINSLKRELRPLSLEDRKEILEDYTLLIDEKISNGLTEEAIFEEMSSPKEIAKQYINELLGDKVIVGDQPKAGKVTLFVFLQFFNFLIGIWIIFSLVVTAGVLVFTGFMIALSSIPAIIAATPFGVVTHLFMVLFLTGVGLLIMNLGLLIGFLTFVLTKKYYAFNLGLLR